MEEHADAKWNQPGWRIEQKYDTDVLIGNWNEERRVVSEDHFRYIPPIYKFVCNVINFFYTMKTNKLCIISLENFPSKVLQLSTHLMLNWHDLIKRFLNYFRKLRHQNGTRRILSNFTSVVASI